MARLLKRPVRPSVVAISSRRLSMRALASDTATWLASTSSVRAHRVAEGRAAARAEHQRAERALVHEQRQHHERRHRRAARFAAREHDLPGGIVVAAVGQRVAVRDHHRDQAGVVLEALADELARALAAHGADLVLVGARSNSVTDREVEGRELARARSRRPR